MDSQKFNFDLITIDQNIRIMIIKPEKIEEIRSLKPGDFAIPKLNYKNIPPRLSRKKYTTKAILTNLQKKGFKEIIDLVFPEGLTFRNEQERIDFLESNILSEIQMAKAGNLQDESLINKIFHSIQIWGGNTARGFYFQKPEKNNFSTKKYIVAVNHILLGEIDNALKIFEEFNQMGISFASKHFSFWSAELQGNNSNGPKQLPILDNLIFNLTYGKGNPTYKFYNQYLGDMYDLIQKLGIEDMSVHTIERQLFNFADSTLGIQWKNLRLKSV